MDIFLNHNFFETFEKYKKQKKEMNGKQQKKEDHNVMEKMDLEDQKNKQ